LFLELINHILQWGARQISSAPSPGGEGWDESEQLFLPQAPHYIGQKKSVVRPLH
jgi:hypothetical protein